MQKLENSYDESSIYSVVINNNQHDPTYIDLWSGNSMADKIMTIWLKIRERLCHNYSLVGFFILHNPTIMKGTSEKNTDAHEEAVARLIEKIFPNPFSIFIEIAE